MSTDADRVVAEKAAADKRIADKTDASAAATADWPTGGYNTFTPLLFTFMCAVLVVCVDVSTICLVRAYIIKIQYVISTAYVMFMIYYWIKLIKQLLNFSTPPQREAEVVLRFWVFVCTISYGKRTSCYIYCPL